LHSLEDLNRIKVMVNQGKEPWKSAWAKLAGAPVTGLTYKDHAVANLSVASGGAAGTGQQDDASAAHFDAIRWYVTGDEAYAKKAIEILNDWSSILKTMGGSNARLQCGISGYHFCNAAEILRSTYPGWAKADQDQFKKMMLEVYYPTIQNWAPTFNGNWDAYMEETMMSIGIFCDSTAMFDKAVNWLLSGQTKGSLTGYIYDSGQCQESTRDQMHVQMGLGAMAGACETGYHQGLDMWGALNNRLLLGFEYTAKYNLGMSVPSEGTLSSGGRGQFRPMWEIVYNHYVNRKGLAAPFTRQVVEKRRPEGYEQDYISLGTLLFYTDGTAISTLSPEGETPRLSVIRNGSGLTVRYTVTRKGPVTLTVRDAVGRDVIDLVRSVQDAGSHESSWRPQGGAATGNYFLRLESPEAAKTEKVTLLP
jgi:hypothetical protein